MKRFAMKICILIALAWGGWWYIATSGLQKGVNAWLDAQSAQGLEASLGDMTRGGFPFRIATTLSDATLTNPATQTTLTVTQAKISTPIYWPGDVTLQLPADPLRIMTPQGALTLLTDGTDAELRLHPGPSLQLEALNAASTNVSLRTQEGEILSISAVDASIEQGDNFETYHFDLGADGVAFGDLLATGLNLPPEWPSQFEPIVAQMTVAFERPWDRTALAVSRPQPRAITIHKVEAAYADLSIQMDADLSVDTNGTPSGMVNLEIRNWQEVFEIAVAATEVPPDWLPIVRQVLTSMSDIDGTLDIEITIANGQMRLGLFPIGSAPRIVIP